MDMAATQPEVAKTAGMKTYRLCELNGGQVQDLRARPRIDFSSIFETVPCFSLCPISTFQWLNVVVSRSLVIFYLEIDIIQIKLSINYKSIQSVTVRCAGLSLIWIALLLGVPGCTNHRGCSNKWRCGSERVREHNFSIDIRPCIVLAVLLCSAELKVESSWKAWLLTTKVLMSLGCTEQLHKHVWWSGPWQGCWESVGLSRSCGKALPSHLVITSSNSVLVGYNLVNGRGFRCM